MRQSMMPDVYIIGSPRAGTTSLYHLLDSHPAICGTRPKEPMFFEHDASYGEKGHVFATEHYDGEDLIMTANTRLCWIKYCAERVHYFSPDAKIFLCIRNPIERFYSHWSFLRNKLCGREHRGFDEVVRESIASFNPYAFWDESEIIPKSDRYAGYFIDHLLHCGLYADTFRRFARYFGSQNIMIIPVGSLTERRHFIFRFLGLDDQEASEDKKVKIDSRWPSVRREAPMNRSEIWQNYPRAYEMLHTFYHQHNRDLNDYLDDAVSLDILDARL